MSQKPCEEIRLYCRHCCLPSRVRTIPASFSSFQYMGDYTFSWVGPLTGSVQRNMSESDLSSFFLCCWSKPEAFVLIGWILCESDPESVCAKRKSPSLTCAGHVVWARDKFLLG